VLQLYNVNYRYAHQGAPAGMTSAATSAGAGGDKSATAQLVAQIPGAESHMLGVVNKDRATEQAPAVVANGSLAALARAHAQDMATRHFFNHVNPDGLSPQDRASRTGVGGSLKTFPTHRVSAT